MRDQVYEILKRKIQNFEFSPGQRLNVEQLSRELGVSRTPVWEAIHRLIQDGFLENIPHHGVYVTELTPSAAIDLYIVRGALEKLVVKLIVESPVEHDFTNLKEILKRQHIAVVEANLDLYSRYDFDFHTSLYKMSKNRFLAETLENIKRRCDLFPCDKKPVLKSLYKDHLMIVDALERKDCQAAEEAFQHHNQTVIERIRECYKSFFER